MKSGGAGGEDTPLLKKKKPTNVRDSADHSPEYSTAGSTHTCPHVATDCCHGRLLDFVHFIHTDFIILSGREREIRLKTIVKSWKACVKVL